MELSTMIEMKLLDLGKSGALLVFFLLFLRAFYSYSLVNIN